MKPRLLAPMLLLVPILMASLAAAQDTYKWVDENGRVTYSDQPPVGKVKSQEVVKIPGSANSGAARQIAEQDSQFRKRQDEAAKKQAIAEKKDQAEAMRQDSCARARGDLRAMRENVPITRVTESGERTLLDSESRDAEVKRLSSFVEENCTQAGG